MYADLHSNRPTSLCMASRSPVTPSATGRIVMPYVNISLTRGKSREYMLRDDFVLQVPGSDLYISPSNGGPSLNP
jgi:hypothetical protein